MAALLCHINCLNYYYYYYYYNGRIDIQVSNLNICALVLSLPVLRSGHSVSDCDRENTFCISSELFPFQLLGICRCTTLGQSWDYCGKSLGFLVMGSGDADCDTD